VNIYNLALGEKEEISHFYHYRSAPAYSGLKNRGCLKDIKSPDIQTIDINVARMDDIIPKFYHVDFIKIDVEGGEYHVLKGAMETIKRCKPYIIFEFGINTSSHYGIDLDMMYDLISVKLGLEITIINRSNKVPLSKSAFAQVCNSGKEWNFLAFQGSRPLVSW
jgi:hypothetical protein